MNISDKFKFQDDKNNDISLVGEVLIDKIFEDNILKKKTLGGSTTNIASNLVSLGITPKLFVNVGDDKNGEYIINELKKRKVDINDLSISHGITSFVDIHVNDENPKPLFHRDSDYKIHLDNDLIEAVKESKIFHFSYWPLSKEPSKSTILDLIDVAKENNVVIGFEPNYHVDLVDEDSIDKIELINIFKKVDIVKPSLDDTIRIFGKRNTFEEYIKIYQELGCKLILLTLGSKGVIVSYNNKLKHYESLASEVKEVTGAGDAFWSGIYAGLLASKTIDEAILYGLLCSKHVLKVVGSYTKLPHYTKLTKRERVVF